MGSERLASFSDSVIAIIITIMVLEMKVPQGTALADLLPLIPVLLSYVLSFVYIGIYWNNHHHMLHLVQEVNGGILWANLHLLFWLSLIPFVTGWMGRNPWAAVPMALYGVVLFMTATAYALLTYCLTVHHGEKSPLALAVGSNHKGKISMMAYATAIVVSFVTPGLAFILYVGVAFMWLIPDRRIEEKLNT